MQPELPTSLNGEDVTKHPTETNGLPPAPLTVAKFAARYGKSPSFGYRMIYAGRVLVIPGTQLLIPHAEILKFEARVEVYNGRKQPRKTRNARKKKVHSGSTLPKSQARDDPVKLADRETLFVEAEPGFIGELVALIRLARRAGRDIKFQRCSAFAHGDQATNQ